MTLIILHRFESLHQTRGDSLRPLQQVTIQLAGQQLNAEPAIPDDIAELLTKLGPGH